ncbi:MAG: SHOCT domain-containing protein [Candidatus Binatia bacterium]
MRCAECGNEIPFAGQVCPHCHRDQSQKRQQVIRAVSVALCLGFVGSLLFGAWGGILGFAFGYAAPFLARGTTPPGIAEVKETLMPKSSETPKSTETSIEVRLRKLNDLRQKGLIDEGEYVERKKAILNEL